MSRKSIRNRNLRAMAMELQSWTKLGEQRITRKSWKKTMTIYCFHCVFPVNRCFIEWLALSCLRNDPLT